MKQELRDECREIFKLLETVRSDIAYFQADEKELRSRLDEIMTEADVDKLESENLEAIKSYRKNSKFDLPRFIKEVPAEKVAAAAKSLDFPKLIEAGVDPQLIEDCKVESEPTPVFTIRERKPKKESKGRKVSNVS